MSNIIELILLLFSIITVFFLVSHSNRKVRELDGLGDIVSKKDGKANTVAQL